MSSRRLIGMQPVGKTDSSPRFAEAEESSIAWRLPSLKRRDGAKRSNDATIARRSEEALEIFHQSLDQEEDAWFLFERSSSRTLFALFDVSITKSERVIKSLNCPVSGKLFGQK